MTTAGQPSPAEPAFEAGGSDPDFYFPPKRTPSPDGSFFRFVRSLPGRLVRSLRS
jgi:hypothetical protein